MTSNDPPDLTVIRGNDLDRYDELCTRLFTDARFTDRPRTGPHTRELALTLAWALYRDPTRTDPGAEDIWHRTARALGGGPDPLAPSPGRRWAKGIRDLVNDDRPHYQPPDLNRSGGLCEGPRLRPYRPRHHTNAGVVHDWTPTPGFVTRSIERDQHPPHRDQQCGERTSHREVTEYDPITGWVAARHWFCSRHREHATRVQEQLDTAHGPRPAPIPNRGGLLPVYFPTLGDWVTIYRWAHTTRWKPSPYGVCADDWPEPGHELVPVRPRLAVIRQLRS